MAKPKPGDPDYEHVKGQMDVYDVLAEIETCNHVDPPTERCPFCGVGPISQDARIRAAVQQRLKGEQDGQADQGK